MIVGCCVIGWVIRICISFEIARWDLILRATLFRRREDNGQLKSASRVESL